jgi:predicted ATP-dependent endonuclease of OLD family
MKWNVFLFPLHLIMFVKKEFSMNEKNQSYIQSVVLEGYKSIQHTEIDFEQGLNIIIGKNGSGKTNFLEFLFNIIFNRYGFYIGEEGSFDFKSFDISIINQEIISTLSISRNQGLQTVKQIDNNETIYEESYSIIRSLEYNQKKSEIEQKIIKLFKLKRRVMVFYHVPKSSLYIDEYRNFELRFSLNGNKGYLMMDFLFDLDMSFQDFFAKEENRKIKSKDLLKQAIENLFKIEIDKNNIVKNLQKFSPIQDLRLSPNINIYTRTSETSIENIYIEFKVSNEWYSWNSLSDGTKRLFYIISEVVTAESIVLLEEPEPGIHPHQLHLLMQFLKEQSETKQIILTTHSPQVLDILSVNELNKIIIAEMTEEGTKLRHLTEKQKKKAARYMEDLFLSDYWVQNAGLEDEQE